MTECFALIFSRNCGCFQKDCFLIPNSESKNVEEHIAFWKSYVSEYLNLLKRHLCCPLNGTRIIYAVNSLYVIELNNLLKTLQIYEDYILSGNFEENLIRITPHTNPVQVGIFIKIFRDYTQNQLDILKYLTITNEAVSIVKINKILDIHNTVLSNFDIFFKGHGGASIESIFRELEGFVETSISMH